MGARQHGVDAVVVEAVLVDLESRLSTIPDAFVALSATVAVEATSRHADALREAARDHYVKKVIDRRTFLAVRDELDRTLHEEVAGGPPVPIPVRFRELFESPREVWPSLSHFDHRAALGVVLDHVVIHPAPRNGGRFRPERVEVVFPGQRSVRTPFPDLSRGIDPDDAFDVCDVARLLDLHPETIHRYLTKGVLRGTKVGRQWSITGAEVARCRDLRNLAGVKRVRRHSVKFAQILREYNAGIGAVDADGRPALAIDVVSADGQPAEGDASRELERPWTAP